MRKQPVYALVDCNNFYTSCEKVMRPDLENKPVVVLSNNDGCIISRSQEAKDLDINMTDPYFKIKHELKAKGVQVFSSNYTLYGDLSQRVMSILEQFSHKVQVYSIDEAFVDLSHVPVADLPNYGQKIRDTILQWIKIPVSVGIGHSKTLAKIAADVAKKSKFSTGSFSLVNSQNSDKILAQTHIHKIWGIGRGFTKQLTNNNIHTALDLKNINDKWVRKNMSVIGERIVKELRGESCISIDTTRSTKRSIMTSRSFGRFIKDYSEMEEAVSNYTTRCGEKLRGQNALASYLTLFIRTNSHNKSTLQYRNHITIELPYPTNYTPELVNYGNLALQKIFKDGYTYKKAGVILTGISPNTGTQLPLFGNVDVKKRQELMVIFDKLNYKMGLNTVKCAKEALPKENEKTENGQRKKIWEMKSGLKSPNYTTRFIELVEVTL